MTQQDCDYSRHIGKTGELVAFMIRQPSRCGKCQKELVDGTLIIIQDDQALCLPCAGLDHLTFLPSGDPAVTRRAGKYSSHKVVVVRWSKAGKRYERQGTLVEQQAIDRARTESAADAATREAKNAKAAVRREIEDKQYLVAFTAELKRLFPGCPPAEAQEIAQHACEKHSGRVGRSASAKELDADKIKLAVIAHIRHVHTGYDGFFEINVRKHDARRMVQAKIQRVLQAWETGSSAPANQCSLAPDMQV